MIVTYVLVKLPLALHVELVTTCRQRPTNASTHSPASESYSMIPGTLMGPPDEPDVPELPELLEFDTEKQKRFETSTPNRVGSAATQYGMGNEPPHGSQTSNNNAVGLMRVPGNTTVLIMP